MAKQRFNFQRFREQVQALLKRLYQTFRSLLDESMFWSPERPSWIYRIIHFWILVGRSCGRNRLPARASALAYATLLALIPMLFIVMSVSSALLKGESEERIGEFIDQVMATVIPPGAPAVVVTNLAPLETSSPAGTNTAAAPDSAAVTAAGALEPAAADGSTNTPAAVATAGPRPPGETNAASSAASCPGT